MIRASALFAVLAMMLGGCIYSKTTVTVNKDGSGLIEQVAYWPDMEKAMPDAPAKKVDLATIKAKQEKVAQTLGKGVTLKSVETIKHEDGRPGAKIVYAFTDINKVEVPYVPASGDASADNDKDKPVTFQYAGGKLTINPSPMDKPDGMKDDDKPANPEQEKKDDQAMTEMFKGSLIQFDVVVAGAISSNNAEFKVANGATLMRMDFDGIAKDPASMAAFKKIKKAKTSADLHALFRQAPLSKHIQVQENKPVIIEFK